MDFPDFNFMFAKNEQHRIKQLMESDDNINNNKVYLKMTDNFYNLVHVIRRSYVS